MKQIFGDHDERITPKMLEESQGASGRYSSSPRIFNPSDHKRRTHVKRLRLVLIQYHEAVRWIDREPRKEPEGKQGGSGCLETSRDARLQLFHPSLSNHQTALSQSLTYSSIYEPLAM